MKPKSIKIDVVNYLLSGVYPIFEVFFYFICFYFILKKKEKLKKEKFDQKGGVAKLMFDLYPSGAQKWANGPRQFVT